MPGFWYMTGSFMWSRQFAPLLALQIAAIEQGLNSYQCDTPVSYEYGGCMRQEISFQCPLQVGEQFTRQCARKACSFLKSGQGLVRHCLKLGNVEQGIYKTAVGLGAQAL